MRAYIPSPSDSELQRTWDLLRAEGDVDPVRYARAVLHRWGLVVEFAIPAPEHKPATEETEP